MGGLKVKRENLKNFILIMFVFIITLVILFPGQQEAKDDSRVIGYIEKTGDSITVSDAKEALDLGVGWLKNNFKDKGVFIYEYDVDNDEYTTKNNMIRQLMASRLFAELSPSDPEIDEMHKKNIEFMLKYWYEEKDGLGYIYYNEKSKLGAIAMALRALVYSPYFDDYSDEAEKFADAILFLQNDDGSFEPWFIEPGYAYNKSYLLTFYSGEALLALVEYYEKTGEKRILDAVVKSQDFYIQEYVVDLHKNYYPAYVPWHTQSLNKLYKITGDKKYAEAIYVLNDELLKIQNYHGMPNILKLGRFYHVDHPEYGSPHSSSDGVYTEGLAYAYEVARMEGDIEHMKSYKRGIAYGIHNLMRNLQFDHGSDKVNGAIKKRWNSNWTRVDCTQHAMDGYLQVMRVFDD